MTRFPPLGYHSRAWACYGHLQAAISALEAVWQDYLDWNGLEPSACTVNDLFH